METTERTELQKPRRVGTFTLGVVLVVSVGDVVKVVVLEVDEKKKRISLSMRQAK